MSIEIKDTQSSPDLRKIAINRVGIKSLRYPIKILQRDGVEQHTIATCDLGVLLPAEQRGTHMSRFVEILNEFTDALTPASFIQLLKKMLKHLQAGQGSISFNFPFFRQKFAPVSKIASLLDYQVTLSAEQNETLQLTFTIVVPVKSLCPCSKEISEFGAHNQRSHVTVTAAWREDLPLEEVIEFIEAEASAEIFSLLKRADEKYITERAYHNPKFAEDLVRDIAASFNADPRFPHYMVEAENFESIHNHTAYARVEK